jgi:hypothetical protein
MSFSLQFSLNKEMSLLLPSSWYSSLCPEEAQLVLGSSSLPTCFLAPSPGLALPEKHERQPCAHAGSTLACGVEPSGAPLSLFFSVWFGYSLLNNYCFPI